MPEKRMVGVCWGIVTALLVTGVGLIVGDAPEVGDNTVVGVVMIPAAMLLATTTIIVCEIRKAISKGYKRGLEDGRRIGSVVDFHR